MMRIFLVVILGFIFIIKVKTDHCGTFKSCTHVLWDNETLPSNIKLQTNQIISVVP